MGDLNKVRLLGGRAEGSGSTQFTTDRQDNFPLAMANETAKRRKRGNLIIAWSIAGFVVFVMAYMMVMIGFRGYHAF